MSNFIDINDYDASIHSEILDALTRKDPLVIEICEERAIAEMRSSLKERYDVDDCNVCFGHCNLPHLLHS